MVLAGLAAAAWFVVSAPVALVWPTEDVGLAPWKVVIDGAALLALMASSTGWRAHVRTAMYVGLLAAAWADSAGVLPLVALVVATLAWLPSDWDQWTDHRHPAGAWSLTPRGRVATECAALLVGLHLVACGWLAMGRHGLSTSGWAPGPDDAPLQWFTYVRAVHWSVDAMTGLGNSDAAPPATTMERVASLVVSGVGLCFLVTALGEMGALFASMDAERDALRQRVAVVHRIARVRRIPRELEEKMVALLEFQFRRHGTIESPDEVLNDMPAPLRSSVLQCIHRSVINKVPFFRDACHVPGLLSELMDAVQPAVFPPDTVLMQVGERADSMLFIVSGDVEVLVPGREGAPIPYVGGGHAMGEIALLQPAETARRSATVRAVTFVEGFELGREAFNRLLERFSELREAVVAYAEERLTRDALHAPDELSRRASEQRLRELRGEGGGHGHGDGDLPEQWRGAIRDAVLEALQRR